MHVAAHPRAQSHRFKSHYAIASVSGENRHACETNGYPLEPTEAAHHAVLFAIRSVLTWNDRQRNDGSPVIVCHHTEILQLITERNDESVVADAMPETHRQVLTILRNNPHVQLLWVPRKLNIAAIEDAKAYSRDATPPGLAPVPLDRSCLVEHLSAPDILTACRSQRRPTWRSLPSHLRDLWVSLLSSVALDDTRSSELRSSLITCAPSIFLDKRDAGTIEELHKRLQSLVASRENVDLALHTFTTRPRPPPPPQCPASSSKRKVEHLIALGAERKAVAQLTAADTVVPVDRLVADELEKLFPKRQPTSDGDDDTDGAPARPTFPDRCTVDSRKVLLQTSRLSRGAAPSFDGWTRELLHPVMVTARPRSTASAATHTITTIVDSLVNGTIDDDTRDFLNAGVLLALRKANRKFRPIVIGSSLLKVAWKLCLADVPTTSALHPAQVTGRRACEKAIQRLHSNLKNGQSALLLDASNAFGVTKRDSIRAALEADEGLRRLLPLFDVSYVSPGSGVAHYGDQEIALDIEEGVKQGCAGAPFLFQVALSAALRNVRTDGDTTIIAIADDVAICGSDRAAMQRARSALERELLKIGIQLNPDKMQALGPLARHFPGKHPSIADYLGALIRAPGTQNQASWDDLRPKYRLRVDAIQRSLGDISKQCAFILLRYVNFAISYVFSNSDPGLTSALRKEHTKWVRQALDTLIGKPLNDPQWKQASLHDSHGGLGLVDWSEVAPLTYATLRSLVTTPAFVASPSQPTQQSIFDVVKKAQARKMEELLESGASNYGPRIRDVLSDQSHFRLRWHFIRPVDKGLRLFDSQWERGMKLLLRVADTDLPNCKPSSGDTSMEHAMVCHRCAGGLWYVRHQRVLFGIQQVLRESGVHLAPVNWRRLGLAKDLTPDGLVFTPSRTLCVDVSVRHVRPQGSNTVDAAYNEKSEKYKNLCATHEWANTPVIFSTYGNPEMRTVRTLRLMASTSKIPGTFTRLVSTAAIAVVRGNADIVELMKAAVPSLDGHTLT